MLCIKVYSHLSKGVSNIEVEILDSNGDACHVRSVDGACDFGWVPATELIEIPDGQGCKNGDDTTGD